MGEITVTSAAPRTVPSPGTRPVLVASHALSSPGTWALGLSLDAQRVLVAPGSSWWRCKLGIELGIMAVT